MVDMGGANDSVLVLRVQPSILHNQLSCRHLGGGAVSGLATCFRASNR